MPEEPESEELQLRRDARTVHEKNPEDENEVHDEHGRVETCHVGVEVLRPKNRPCIANAARGLAVPERQPRQDADGPQPDEVLAAQYARQSGIAFFVTR